MAVKLNRIAFDFAKELIVAGRFVFDERDAWSEHRPSAQTENEFLAAHGFREYAKWYLGINEEKHKNTKGRHEFPYGDFENVHRCGVLTAESRAANTSTSTSPIMDLGSHHSLNCGRAPLRAYLKPGDNTVAPITTRAKLDPKRGSVEEFARYY